MCNSRINLDDSHVLLFVISSVIPHIFDSVTHWKSREYLTFLCMHVDKFILS